MGMAAAEKPFHILAVDDSLLDRKLIERLLRTSSYQVTTVDSGSKALEFLLSHLSPTNQIEHEQISLSPKKKDVEVNLIITDYCMPEMTGYDLLKKIKESSSLRNIPVVIMSSENIPSRISRCLEEGAEEFLLKPVRMSDVSKLRPHMLKAGYDGKEEPGKLKDRDDLRVFAQEQQLQQQQQQPAKQQQQEQQNNNKRKSLEEGISVEGTCHRYSGLTVA